MRGALAPAQVDELIARIIPADAGSTKIDETLFGATEDHPRGCGEHGYGLANSGMKTGSSPRMRGAHGNAPSPVWIKRIIPADAGSTATW